MLCNASTASADDLPTARKGSRRRRLWELPPTAHELLLGLALPADLLRSTVAKAIGRERAVRCVISGSDAELLFSVVHDLATRNVVSEALHKLLDARHAGALREVALLRKTTDTGLRARWSQALTSPSPSGAPMAIDVPGLLWALLSHADGEALQDALLREASTWAYARTRAALGLADERATFQRDREELIADLTRTRAAAVQAQTMLSQQAQTHALELAKLRGELARASAAAARETAPAATERPAPIRRIQQAPVAAELTPKPVPVPIRIGLPEPAEPADLRGCRVLCVGGMQGAVEHYRAVVEARGALFSHHDGGIENGARRLQAQLAAADLVICQAGCINHEAYQRIKRLCKRDGKPCRYVQRPSLSQFVSCLAAA